MNDEWDDVAAESPALRGGLCEFDKVYVRRKQRFYSRSVPETGDTALTGISKCIKSP